MSTITAESKFTALESYGDFELSGRFIPERQEMLRAEYQVDCFRDSPKTLFRVSVYAWKIDIISKRPDLLESKMRDQAIAQAKQLIDAGQETQIEKPIEHPFKF